MCIFCKIKQGRLLPWLSHVNPRILLVRYKMHRFHPLRGFDWPYLFKIYLYNQPFSSSQSRHYSSESDYISLEMKAAHPSEARVSWRNRLQSCEQDLSPDRSLILSDVVI
jgi:hypothetical protein